MICKNISSISVCGVVRQVGKFTCMEGFSPKAMSRVSKAAASMCRWVLALSLYHTTERSLLPKRQALRQAETELEKSEEDLKVTFRRCSISILVVNEVVMICERHLMCCFWYHP